MTTPPTFRQLLARPTAPMGVFCGLGSIDAIELACDSGFDYIIVDLQHGAFSLDGMRHALRAIEAAGSCAVARLPAGGYSVVEPVLDAGYGALIAPMVNSARDARELVRAACYPPRGLRSQSSCRASLRAGEGYRDHIDDELVLLAMIEHIDAVEACEDILLEPGISGILIGPTDLASSLRGSDEPAAQMKQAIARAKAAAHRHDRWVGIAAKTIEAAKGYASDGYQFIIHGTDRRFLQQGFVNAITNWRDGKTRG